MEFTPAYRCGYDEIGKHAGFRFQCRKACGFESHYPYHVGASFISLAPTYFISQSALTPLLLLSNCDPLPLSFGLVLPLRGAFIAHMKISVLTALYTSEQSQLCSGVFMSAAKRCHPLTPLSPRDHPCIFPSPAPLPARLSSCIQQKFYSYLLYCPADGHDPVSPSLFSKKSHVSKNHSFLWPDPGDSAPPPRYFVMILT